jgi:signal transduction histidine kinase
VELLDIIGESISPEEQKEHLTKVINSIDYMTDMLNDVITINRSDSGNLVAKRKLINLIDFTKQLIDEIIVSAGNNVEIEFEANKKHFHTYTDEKLYRQIVTNLISNAVKYTPNDKSIICTLIINKKEYILKVIDCGIGIPELELKDIFSPFHRASNIKNEPGTGLGLAITKRSVDTLGGTIEVESQLNKGSTFTVILPVITEES